MAPLLLFVVICCTTSCTTNYKLYNKSNAYKKPQYLNVRKVTDVIMTESDVCYFEVNAVFNGEPVELLEENTGDDMGKEVLCFLAHLCYTSVARSF